MEEDFFECYCEWAETAIWDDDYWKSSKDISDNSEKYSILPKRNWDEDDFEIPY